MTRFVRPKPTAKLDTSARQELLREHYDHYAAMAQTAPQVLNVKLPRATLAPFLDEIGVQLLGEAERLAREPGPVKAFLDQNPLPVGLRKHVPDSYRAFCLLLNGLKQWTATEQAATDRFVLGPAARTACRAAVSRCIITGDALGSDAELHHPVRDGRPPIYISKAGHEQIEGQVAGKRGGTSTPANRSNSLWAPGDESVMARVLEVKGNESWKQLRRGCLDALGREPNHSKSKNVQRNARAFASRAGTATGLTSEEILDWLDRNNLGTDS